MHRELSLTHAGLEVPVIQLQLSAELRSESLQDTCGRGCTFVMRQHTDGLQSHKTD